MKRIVAALALATFITAAPALADSEQKIGIVDMQRAVSETKEGVAARADIFKKTELLNGELRAIQGDFSKLKNELDKDGASMKAEARAEKERQLQQKARDFQKRQRDAQEEVKQMEADMLQKIVGRLSELMKKIGEEGDYAAIIEQGAGVKYFSKKADITSILIKKADETSGK